MRESLRRSPAWLALFASTFVAGGACTPSVPLSYGPAPCVGATVMCAATGLCVDPKAGTTDIPDPKQCVPGYTVRQGGTVYLPMPVSRTDQVTRHDTMSLLVVHDPELLNGSVVVPVEA